jgi:hypothetical protein
VVSIAFKAAGVSAANASIVQGTVGSETQNHGALSAATTAGRVDIGGWLQIRL